MLVRIRTVAALLLTGLACSSDALAADVTGTWHLPAGSVAEQTWTITTGTGTLAGEGHGGAYTWPIEGSLTGDSVRVKTAYRETSYTAYFVGTVSADGATMSGTWNTGSYEDAEASGFTWTANREGGAPDPDPVPPPDPAKRGTGTSVSCNRGAEPSSPFTCTIAVADVDPGTASAPSGTVTLSSNQTDGSFPSGATCTLAPSQTNPAVTSCAVTFRAGPRGAVLTGTYAGDAAHNGSSGEFTVFGQCTDPITLQAACADAGGAPAVCGPTGTIFPQCNLPTSLPVICGPTASILVACQPPDNYVAACGGFGTILPACNLPPPRIPQICGGTGTLLPPCTGANQPVLVCGPSTGTVLPGCNFTAGVTARPIDLTGGGANVDVTIDCDAASRTRNGPSPTTSRRVCRTVGTVRLESWVEGRKLALGAMAASQSMTQANVRFEQAAAGLTRPNGGLCSSAPNDASCRQRQALLRRLVLENAETYRTRAARLADEALDPRRTTPRPVSQLMGILSSRSGTAAGTRWGPDYRTTTDVPNGDAIADFAAPAGPWAEALQGDWCDYTKLRTGATICTIAPRQAPEASAAARKQAKPRRALVTRKVRLRPGKPVHVRLRLDKRQVRAFARSVGRNDKHLLVRLVVGVKVKPRPAARVLDLRLPIKGR